MPNKVKRRRKIQTDMKGLGLKAGIPNDQLVNYVTNGLLYHTLWQGYDVIPVHKFCTKLGHFFRREVTTVS